MMGRKMEILRVRDDALKFVFGGEPVAKARPRFNSRTGTVYTHDKTKSYEEFLKLSAHAQMCGKAPLKGAICAQVAAFFRPPKVLLKNEKYRLERPLKRPDADNVAKAVLDGLNGIAYDDDKQVVELAVAKFYSEEPRVEVLLRGIYENLSGF